MFISLAATSTGRHICMCFLQLADVLEKVWRRSEAQLAPTETLLCRRVRVRRGRTVGAVPYQIRLLRY